MSQLRHPAQRWVLALALLLLLPADAAAASVTFGNATCEYWLAEESNVGG